MKNIFDATNWKEEYKAMKLLTKKQIELLDHGPKSLSASWLIGAMHNDWKRIKGYIDPMPPNCSSSFREFEASIKNSSVNINKNQSND